MCCVVLSVVKSIVNEAGEISGDRTSASNMTAETMFPILLFVILQSNLLEPHHALSFLEMYAVAGGQGIARGIEEYYVTSLGAAVAWVLRQKPNDTIEETRLLTAQKKWTIPATDAKSRCSSSTSVVINEDFGGIGEKAAAERIEKWIEDEELVEDMFEIMA
eukprot:TRINITY_DN134_c1_g1_i1.p1 TRINITY_DN134_c1_g1~~TRINITY_DN134_c1_g1_i1.p1  ORF type:complete len:162 (+),score=37.23 TRINITY_DN134_c1_g1_i1:315-800(+)